MDTDCGKDEPSGLSEDSSVCRGVLVCSVAEGFFPLPAQSSPVPYPLEQSLTAGASLVSECRFDAEVPFAKGGMSLCRRDSVFHVDQEALYSAAMGNVTCKQKNIRFTY